MSYCRWSSIVYEDSPEAAQEYVDRIKDMDSKEFAELYCSGKYHENIEALGAVKSQAYVYENNYGGFTCHIAGGETFSSSLPDMIDYLVDKKAGGVAVPQDAIDALKEEFAEVSL
jgi:hypothetical protein